MTAPPHGASAQAFERNSRGEEWPCATTGMHEVREGNSRERNQLGVNLNLKFPHAGMFGMAEQRHFERLPVNPVMHPQLPGAGFEKLLDIVAAWRQEALAGLLQCLERDSNALRLAYGQRAEDLGRLMRKFNF